MTANPHYFLTPEAMYAAAQERAAQIVQINRDAETIKRADANRLADVQRGLDAIDACGRDLELRALKLAALKWEYTVESLLNLAQEHFGTDKPNPSFLWEVITESQGKRDAAALAVEGKRREIEHKTTRKDVANG